MCVGWTERPPVIHVSFSPEAAASAPPGPILRHLSTFFTPSQRVYGGTGAPRPHPPSHPHLHGPLKSQIQLVGQPCCLARIYLL